MENGMFLCFVYFPHVCLFCTEESSSFVGATVQQQGLLPYELSSHSTFVERPAAENRQITRASDIKPTC